MTWQLIPADCIEAMRGMDEASVDAIVTDPPYGLEFMGKEWDRLTRNAMMPASVADAEWNAAHPQQDEPGTKSGMARRMRDRPDLGGSLKYAAAIQEWHQAWATEALRVLKPGGHLLSFGGTRTYHRLTCALEDVGFEIRDCLAWLYGSGFPKSLDVSKAIDKAAGAAREVVGVSEYAANRPPRAMNPGGGPREVEDDRLLTAPATPDAERWQGWGTALKPAFEPIVLARKPLSGTVAQNVLEHGTGALNVDAARIEGQWTTWQAQQGKPIPANRGGEVGFSPEGYVSEQHPAGRWPANVLLDAEAAAALDEQSGPAGSFSTTPGSDGRGMFGDRRGGTTHDTRDAGGASRFFYTAKTSRAERNRGLYGWPERMPDNAVDRASQRSGDEAAPGRGSLTQPMANHHPTVKPVDLMQWLCRLITPPGGIVLDPFTGSGSTGIAALREGFSFIGIERELEYVEIARARIIGDAPLFAAGTEVIAEANST